MATRRSFSTSKDFLRVLPSVPTATPVNSRPAHGALPLPALHPYPYSVDSGPKITVEKQLVELVCYRKSRQTEVLDMLWTIFVILLVLWLLGFSFHVAGGLIHLLLVIAVIVLIINLLSGRSTAV